MLETSLHCVWHLCAERDPWQSVYQPSWAAVGFRPSFHWGAVDTNLPHTPTHKCHHHHIQTCMCTHFRTQSFICLVCTEQGPRGCTQKQSTSLPSLFGNMDLTWSCCMTHNQSMLSCVTQSGLKWSRNIQQGQLHYVWAWVNDFNICQTVSVNISIWIMHDPGTHWHRRAYLFKYRETVLEILYLETKMIRPSQYNQ